MTITERIEIAIFGAVIIVGLPVVMILTRAIAG
jgi:hypothetical protein